MKKQSHARHKPKPVLVRLRNLVFALNTVLSTIHLSDLPSRVRELPDERTVRYYTTLGLISPACRFDGRRALYGKRHLIQLLAIKRLQSRGYSIRDIQHHLSDASPAELAATARVDPVVIQKALVDAARDSSLNTWPRPSENVDEPEQSPSAAPEPSLRSYRVAAGIYLTIDPGFGNLPATEIQRHLKSFAEHFSADPPVHAFAE